VILHTVRYERGGLQATKWWPRAISDNWNANTNNYARALVDLNVTWANETKIGAH
jgi:hypothetical protein